jgi:endonuclease/exonuclease/phosphatase family metal-dependent hydrolase
MMGIKKIYVFILVSLMMINSCVWEDEKGSVKVMSFNVRYDNPADGENSWSNRKDLVISTLIDRSPDIIGMQEVLKSQLDDLDKLLPWYDYIGVGRIDGKEAGEYCPVFYKMNRFDVLDQGTLWLSDKPDSIGSTGWDAALPRIMTWVLFNDRFVNKKFYFLNTHFDHQGETARIESARLIKTFANTLNDAPIILSGDFNCIDSSEPYAEIVSENGIKLYDACKKSVLAPKGDQGTFNGFGKKFPPMRIDFIFGNSSWRIYEFRTLQITEGDVYISDHYPIESIMKIIPTD